MFRSLVVLLFVSALSACSDSSSGGGGLPPDPSACGARNEACCASAPTCDVGLTCQSGTCKTPPTSCGAEGAACCATGTACTGSLVCSVSHVCEVPPPPPPPPPATCDDPFPEAPSVSLAVAPEAILSADTDGDGDLDIVVAGGGFGLYVLRNDGTGTFTTNPKYSMQAFRMVAGDFKEDGKVDLVVSNMSNYVTFMPGPGPATTGWSSLPTGTASMGMAAADVNGDGHLDLITANRDAESVSVLTGNGDGTFDPKVDYLVDATVMTRQPTAVAVGDLNGDGWPDIAAVGETMANVAVLFNSGTGTFGAPVLLAGAWDSAFDVTIADFNADGKLDVAAPLRGYDYVEVYLALDGGVFAEPTHLPSGGKSVAIGSGHLDGGATQDLVALTNESNALSILTGQGDGTFLPATVYGTAPQPSAMALGDYDGDGDLDVAVASYWKPVVQLFKNDGAGHVGATPVVTTATAPNAVTAARLDPDAYPELIYVTRATNTVTVLPALGDGRFGTPATFAVGTGPVDVTVGTVNGDTIPDLVTANEDGTVSVLMGNGDGTYAAKIDLVSSATTTSCAVALGDFDEDLDDDILLSSYSDNVTYLIESNGDGSFQPPVIATAFDGEPIVADLDGDGHLDLAVSGYSLSVFVLGAGDGTFSAPVQTLSNLGLEVADVDGDGDLDYVERSLTSSLKTYLKGAGNSYTYTVPRSPPPNYDSFALLDADGDGFTDLASTGDFLAVDLGKGDGTYRARATYGAGALPKSLVAADLDADGHDDVVIGSAYSKSLRVLMSVCQ